MIRRHMTTATIIVLVCASVLGIVIQARNGEAGAVVPPPGQKVTSIKPVDDNMPPPLPDPGFVRKMVFRRFPGIDSQKVGDFLDDNYAEEMVEFRKLAEWKPREAMSMLTVMVQEALELMEIKKTNPEMFESKVSQLRLTKKIERLSKAIRNSKGVELEKQKEALRKALYEAFGVRQELMKRELAGMSEELEKLEGLVAKRAKNRDAIVSGKMDELLNDVYAMRW